ncbi:MAG: hypothetical protein ABW019_02310 [Chitinophagaceae bacterium]
MKKRVWFSLFLVFLLVAASQPVAAQCSICTKTAQQLGEKPAAGLNAGILYLAFTPFLIVGYIGYRWWQRNKESQ